MIPALVSLDMAKSHLRILGNDLDTDIDSKRRMASSIVLNHCKLFSVLDIPADWIVNASDTDIGSPIESDLILLEDYVFSPPESPLESPPDVIFARVPGIIQAAVLLVLGNLFDNPEGEILTDTIKDLLAPFRNPTWA